MAEQLTDNGPGWVQMYHPSSENDDVTGEQPRAEVTVQAFEEVWEPKGWKLVEGPDAKKEAAAAVKAAAENKDKGA